jgi:hypothetical protein
MLQDKPRTEAYRDAILNNKHVFKDKAGTGEPNYVCTLPFRGSAKQTQFACEFCFQ